MGAAAICIFLFVLIKNENLEKELALNVGVLEPANDPTPIYRCHFPENAMIVFMGGTVAQMHPSQDIIEIAGHTILSISPKKNQPNIISITTLEIFDDRFDNIAHIEGDKLWVNPTARQERPDKSTLIVYDHTGLEVLKIRFLNPHALAIRGVFRYQSFGMVVATTVSEMITTATFDPHKIVSADANEPLGTDGACILGPAKAIIGIGP